MAQTSAYYVPRGCQFLGSDSHLRCSPLNCSGSAQDRLKAASSALVSYHVSLVDQVELDACEKIEGFRPTSSEAVKFLRCCHYNMRGREIPKGVARVAIPSDERNLDPQIQRSQSCRPIVEPLFTQGLIWGHVYDLAMTTDLRLATQCSHLAVVL